MSMRVNWSAISTIIGRLATIGTIGAVPFMIFSCIKQEVDDNHALKEAAVVTEQERTFTLVDSDTVKMERNKLIYFFNFDMRHLTIKGKIADYNLDTTYTFDQYNDQARINEVRASGCVIARNFSAMALNEQTPETVRKGHAAATAFAANHCPQPAPGNG